MCTSYPYSYDDSPQMVSGFGSPTPTEGDDGPYIYQGHAERGYDEPKYSQYVSLTFKPRCNHANLLHQDDRYSPEHHDSPYNSQYSTPATPPPHYQDTMRTRSGLDISRAQSIGPMPVDRPRQQAVSRVRRTKKEKIRAEKKIAKLEQPLSVLTRDWTHVPVVDIAAYVNRSAEIRRKEIEEGKNPGKVKRPMNSFMLYRKAYQNRTKDWCLQNNHQVVSQVCGDSWPLEPEEIKDQFTEWARIERINHSLAHPGYKFSPTKPGTAKMGKRKMSEEIYSDDESGSEGYDWKDDRMFVRDRKKQRSTPRLETPPRAVSYPPTHSPYYYSSREASLEPGSGGVHRSSYQANNPGLPLPLAYQAQLQGGEYYQQSVHNFHHIPGTQDVFLKRTSTPGVHQPYPGHGMDGQDFDLLRSYPSYDQYPPRIDPLLMTNDQAFDSNLFNDQSQDVLSLNGSHHDGGWPQTTYDPNTSHSIKTEPFISVPDREQQIATTQEPVSNNLIINRDPWPLETLENGNEFDKWMDDEHNALAARVAV